jgi:uncharacterized membrane protein YeiH
VTAVGGGTVRDVLLDRHPIFWLADPTYLVVIIASALITVVVARLLRPKRNALLVADALGLGLFSVAGARIAEAAGLPGVSVVLLGAVTGAAGGVVRDVLSAEIPLVLRRGNLYASAAIAGTAAYRGLKVAGVPGEAAAIAGIACITALRLAAITWDLQLPEFYLSDDDEPPTPTVPTPPTRPPAA